jgi:hypothetical protein
MTVADSEPSGASRRCSNSKPLGTTGGLRPSALMPIHFLSFMNRHIPPYRSQRRAPVMGVGGVTLLMLVTMVLTTSPAFGRPSETGLAGSQEAQFTSIRTQGSEAPAQRVDRRRSITPRQIRPSGQILALTLRPSAATLKTARTAVLPLVDRPVLTPRDRLRVSLLNLPPPLA